MKRRTPLASFWRRTAMALGAMTCLGGSIAVAAPAAAFQLVTSDEAALPDGTVATLKLRGSPTHRPSIVVVWPSPDAGLVHSPLDVKLKFHAFGGARIDPETVVVTYVKQPAIDITQRIASFISADGITVSSAEVPAGRHQFWIEVRDSDGRVGSAELDFEVAK